MKEHSDIGVQAEPGSRWNMKVGAKKVSKDVGMFDVLDQEL